jgi:hypothetical protein
MIPGGAEERLDVKVLLDPLEKLLNAPRTLLLKSHLLTRVSFAVR